MNRPDDVQIDWHADLKLRLERGSPPLTYNMRQYLLNKIKSDAHWKHDNCEKAEARFEVMENEINILTAEVKTCERQLAEVDDVVSRLMQKCISFEAKIKSLEKLAFDAR